MLTRSIERLLFALIACVALVALPACGGSTQHPGASTSAEVAAAPLPAIPEEPLALLPQNAQMVARIDLERLRASPHFPVAESWLTHAACVEANASQWLTQRTSRLALASAGDGKQWVAVARGDYQAEDAAQVATQLFARQHLPLPAVTARGRFNSFTGPEYSFMQLDPHTFAIGDNWSLVALTAVADGKAANWEHGSVPLPNFDNIPWLVEHSVAAIGKPDPEIVARIKSALGDAGASELGAGLEHSTAALGLSLTDSASATAQIFYADPGIAEQNADRIHRLLDRMGFVLRLIGIPSALTHPKLEAQGQKLEIGLELSRSDIDSLAEKLDAFLPACGG